jgi:outer membrane protein assembly factor BamB/ferredoxin
MQIRLNEITVEVQPHETVLQVARRMGEEIPTLCHADGHAHKASCMVCAVMNRANGQVIPSCTTLVTEGMDIDTRSAEVQQLRRGSLELLLSDHRADCYAPCSMVCPHGVEVAEVLRLYDASASQTGACDAEACEGAPREMELRAAARRLLPDPLPCDGCKAPCEKACRRGTVDGAVQIRTILRALQESAGEKQPASQPKSAQAEAPQPKTPASIGEAPRFHSRLGRFTPAEKARLQAAPPTPSRCLHCACEGADGCKLRRYADLLGITRPRYAASSALPTAQARQPIGGELCFEPAKCVRCGLCVYNTTDGFTFRDRGFGMQVVLPAGSEANVPPQTADLCPTGALYRLKGLKSLLPLLILLLLTACDPTGGSSGAGSLDWHLFRGDATLSGYTDTPLPKHPALLWSYRSDVRTVASPVVDGGTTYWCDRRGNVRGVDLAGRLTFEYALQTPVEATPMIHDSVLYIGRIDGVLTALSLARRDTLWNYATEGQISASPNILRFKGSEAVVVGSYDNYLYCLDARRGTLLSRFPSGYYLNGAAALWHHYVVFGGCDAWLRLIDCRTGTPTDSLKLDAYIPASPALMGDYCYVGDYAGNIYKLMLDDGRIVRHRKIVCEANAGNADGGSTANGSSSGDGGSYISVPAVDDNTFYYFDGGRRLRAVSRKGGSERWSYLLKGDCGESSPVVCADRLLVCTKTGIVTILDADSGALLWEYDAGEQIIGSPAVIRGRFLVLTSRGTLLCFGDEKQDNI